MTMGAIIVQQASVCTAALQRHAKQVQ
jgi:hypothetical protein